MSTQPADKPRPAPIFRPPTTYDIQRRNRFLVAGLAVVGAVLFAVSYFLPYWNFALVAPQYPEGLFLQINLSGVTGDVAEIDILNHYIGMQSMSKAAELERAWSTWFVGAAGLGVIGAVLAAGRKLNWFVVVPAIGLPLGFVLDTWWWMYKFGHELDDKAPINFDPFMPQLVGEGMIGRFQTWAWPGSGFWVAVSAVGVVALAVWLRQRVCRTCPDGGFCGATCGHLLLETGSFGKKP